MKTSIKPFIVLLCLLSSLLLSAVVPADTARVGGHQRLYERYFSRAEYDSCLTVCDSLLPLDSSIARLLQARIYFTEHRWDEAIQASGHVSAGRLWLQESWEIAFWSALMVHDLGMATRSARAITRTHPSDPAYEGYSRHVREVWCLFDISCAEIGCLVLLWLLVVYLCWPSGGGQGRWGPAQLLPLSLLLTGAMSCVAYLLFFHFAPWIHSGNIHYPAEAYNPCVIRDFTFDHDGREGYVLYALFLWVVLSSWLGYIIVVRLHSRWQQWLVLAIAAMLSAGLLAMVGLYMPFAIAPQHWHTAVPVSIVFGILCWIVSGRAATYPRMVATGVCILAVAVFALPLEHISIYDYSYIWAPALRLYHGVPLREVYFQYDLYLSGLALAFLKCDIDLVYFPILAQVGYLVFLLALYFFSRSWFRDKRLPVLLFLFALLWRYYANMDPLGQFQITPWRLDLWLPLLILAHRYGVRHWLVALFLGLLIVFHRNFGLLYLAAYLQILLIWSVIRLRRNRGKRSLAYSLCGLSCALCPAALTILCALCAVYLLSGSLMPESAVLYSRIGIGMIPIARTSIYWYMPVILASIAILTYRYRALLGSRYSMAALFLVLLTTAESMYFFGRSHEHNVINLAGPISLCLFLIIDIIGIAIRSGADSGKSKSKTGIVYRAVPVLLLVLVFFTYYDWMANKLRQQCDNAVAGQLLMPLEFEFDFAALRSATRGSKDVFFMDFTNDFMHYYRGGYAPQGYYCPVDAWVLKKDMAAMMQQLLDRGYYIVAMDNSYPQEFMPLLHYGTATQQKGYLLLHQ